MVAIPNSSKITLAGPSLVFKLINTSNKQVYAHSSSPSVTAIKTLQNEGITLYSSDKPENISQIEIDRAEAGSILYFYANMDQDPIMTVSFGMSIYEPVKIGDLSKSHSVDNVHLQVKQEGPVTREISSVKLGVSNLPFIIL